MLVESELFGASKGSHSSAFESTRGKIGAAERGTLFLDEINLMPKEVQSKLLQFLNSNEYYPLGSTRLIKSDIRIICATNSDLEQQVLLGNFRQDLYYRVSAFPIELPPLRARKDDIVTFAESFKKRSQEIHNLPQIPFSKVNFERILQYAWPGNIRELLHKVESACIRAMADGSSEVEPRHLSLPKAARPKETGFKHATKEFQRTYLREKLDLFDWNISKTAKELEMSRSHLHSLMNSLEIDKEVTYSASNDGTVVELLSVN